MPPKAAGRIKVRPVLEPLSTNRFYAGIRQKPGPKRKLLAQQLRSLPKRVENPYRTYTVSYKLRVLSYWATPSIPISPTKLRKPTRAEVAERFKVAGSNLSRWRNDEAAGNFESLERSQCRGTGGGRKRKWEILEQELYDQFRIRFPFSNGWFCSFLSWH